ncbi:hypothetical protein [Pseudomonas kuykendallii]|uniref:hypothetical protein n=1 Tax=Pseudomonas kuykendallii TaxID=1007099 RepID=UPI002897973E|nr:hypothetical protein [Pseudomonas kuykendallii]
MEIKLPINPRVREAIEKEMVGGTPLIEKDAFDPRVNNRHDSLIPLVDGLHKDFFRFNAGAGFVLNYVRFIEGAVTERLTQAIFQARPELYDWAFDQCSGYPAVARLSKIKRLTSEQIGRLEWGVKRRLLEEDMGV